MSRKAERERAILQTVQGGICKGDLIRKLIGASCKQSVIKSFSRAYRNLLRKGTIVEELKTILRGYRIVIVTWVNCTLRNEITKLGNNS